MADPTQPFPPQANPPTQSTPVPPPPPPQTSAAGDDPFGFPPATNPPAAQPEDTTPANYQIGSKLPKIIEIKIPAHNLSFDEQHFLHMLGGSISLTRDEKKRIIDSVPKLRQSQIDELVRIFEEERHKFAELSAKHVDQLKKLEEQHWRDWQDIELSQKAEAKQSNDQAQADEIRKKLGL